MKKKNPVYYGSGCGKFEHFEWKLQLTLTTGGDAQTSIRFVTINGTEHRLGHSYSHRREIELFFF